MTDTTTLAPTDDLQKRCAEIIGWHRTGVLVGDTLRSHAESKWPGDIHNLQMAERATENEALCFIAKWGAPAPANFPERITALLHEVKRGPWEDASGEPLQDDAAAALAWIAAPPAQEAQLNPDMPTQELRLHMGELTTDEVLVARAAIRWANSQKEARVPLTSEQQRCIAEAHNVAACEEYFSVRPQIDYSVNRRIFEAGFSKGYGITAAQKGTP